jgi:hypothetical protein
VATAPVATPHVLATIDALRELLAVLRPLVAVRMNFNVRVSACPI